MADIDGIKDGKDFHLDRPQKSKAFEIKGANGQDWGMQSRLARIFRPDSGKTVMLAFDHGYFQGPTSGLERIDVNIEPLFPHVDVLMCTRGVARSIVDPNINKPLALRCSAGNSMMGDLSNETVGVDIQDIIKLNTVAMAAQIYIGAEHEHQSIKNVLQLIDWGHQYGIPTMAVTGVGKEMKRDARYFGLATRIAAEIGANIIKSYFIEDGFEKVVAACPVPIVIAGGKKLPELEALEMAYKAIDQGAAGVDMGRNIFQSSNPIAMVKAVNAVVHAGEKPEKAYQMFQDLGN